METDELIALIDLDGTIVDYDTTMNKDLESLRSPRDPIFGKSGDDTRDPPWLKARKNMVRNQPGWWKNLPEHEPGFEILTLIKELEFQPMILSKGPRSNHVAWMEKLEWCKHHVPHIPVTITEDKSYVFGLVLVDDWPPYGSKWLKRHEHGLLIVPAHHWNEIDKYPEGLHDRIFRYVDYSQMPSLHKRLIAVRDQA